MFRSVLKTALSAVTNLFAIVPVRLSLRTLALTASLAVLVQPVSEAAATTFLYDVFFSRPVDFPGFIGPTPDFVQGTITTDCNNCVMVQSDIVDWRLAISTHGAPSSTLLGPLSGNNSIISFGPSNFVVATSVGLFFDFNAEAANRLGFSGVGGASGIFLQFSNGPTSVSLYGITWGLPGVTVNISPTSDQIGTAVSSVPEPSTWALMLLGFAGLGFVFHRSRRKLMLALSTA